MEVWLLISRNLVTLGMVWGSLGRAAREAEGRPL
jgi:hypothetical protein